MKKLRTTPTPLFFGGAKIPNQKSKYARALHEIDVICMYFLKEIRCIHCWKCNCMILHYISFHCKSVIFLLCFPSTRQATSTCFCVNFKDLKSMSSVRFTNCSSAMTFSGHLHWKLKPMGFLPSLFHLNLGFPLHLEDLEAITNINIIQDCFGKGM